MMHTQYNLKTAAEIQANRVPESDFELKQANVLKTAKDLRIKEVFSVTDNEVSQNKGQRLSVTLVSSQIYTAASNDYLIGVSSLGLAPTVGLQLPSITGMGKTFKVKDMVGGALTTNITIISEGEKTIDGATSTTLNANYQVKTFYTDSFNWFTC